MAPFTYSPPQLRHFYTQANGTRLHWAEQGSDRERPPILLLHGLVDSHLTWLGLAAVLASGRRVLMPDLPGCGLSDRPDASYELRWHADTIAAWLKAIDVGQVDVVGHSFGGGVAQMLLLERPMPMRRLVLVASGGLGRDVGFLLRLATLPGVVEYFGQPFMGLCTRLALRGLGEFVPESYVSQLCTMNASQGSARAFARTVRDVIDWRGQRRAFFDRCDEVVLPPTAAFWGDRDPVIPIAHAKAFVDAFRGVTFECFQGCGHYPHHEQPERFARALLAFLDDRAVGPTRVDAVPLPIGSALPRLGSASLGRTVT
jgi:pimeloyl-ACP methyl ester carboxylesterase